MPQISMNTPAPPSLQIGRYDSQALQREQPYAYLAPVEWNGALLPDGPRYPLLVMLHGRDGHHTDWTLNTRIARYVAASSLVVAFPEGANGWYTNALDGSGDYEDDLIRDFLPHLQATLPILSPGKAWATGGLSMGGYGAVKLALKYPHLFSTALSHSGAFDRPVTQMPHPELRAIFGDPDTDADRFREENPFWLAELAMSRWPTERPFLYLDCGLNDHLLESNRRFKDHLHFLGYPHIYQEMPGYHTWPYWDRAFRAIFPTLAKRLLPRE